MGFFSRIIGYEPGGVHHVRITDLVFLKAQKLLLTDEELNKHYKEVAKKEDCAKYEAHDFPVTEIIGSFMVSYELQEENNGTHENLRISNIQLGRKDQVEYERFVERYNQRIQMKIDDKEEAWSSMGFGGKLFTMAASLAGEGIAKAATGKSKDIREFEKHFANYICGDSPEAKDYLLKFANEFGVDEGVIAVARAIRIHFWIAEFAKYNRRK
jgi:hypothetical protein